MDRFVRVLRQVDRRLWAQVATAFGVAALGLSVSLLLALLWLLLRALAAVVARARDELRRTVGRLDPNGTETRRTTEIGGVLFWGAFASVLGVIGTLGGVAVMARYLEQAADASASLIWGGLRVALIPTAFGLGLLALCLLAWYGLRTAHRRAASG
jgi:hypothetical protein